MKVNNQTPIQPRYPALHQVPVQPQAPVQPQYPGPYQVPVQPQLPAAIGQPIIDSYPLITEDSLISGAYNSPDGKRILKTAISNMEYKTPAEIAAAGERCIAKMGFLHQSEIHNKYNDNNITLGDYAAAAYFMKNENVGNKFGLIGSPNARDVRIRGSTSSTTQF